MAYTLIGGLWLTVEGILGSIEVNPNIQSLLFEDDAFKGIVLALLSTYGLYLIGSLLMLDPWHMFTYTVDGYEKAKDALLASRNENKARNMNVLTEEEYRKRFRIYFVLLWVLTNALLVTLVISISPTLLPETTTINAYVKFILWSVAALAAFRFFGSLTYFIFEIPKTLKSLIPRRQAPMAPANN
ncbi:6100_t:CDS:2, partial [Cetraspora pellucida]